MKQPPQPQRRSTIFFLLLAAILPGTVPFEVHAQTPPVSLSLRGYWPGVPSGGVYDLKVVGSHAYGAAGNGFIVLDVSQPTGPVAVGRYDTGGIVTGVDVVGSFAYVTDGGGGLHVIDIADPTRPLPVGRYEGLGVPCGVPRVQVQGGYAYVTASGDRVGMQVIDVSNPATPTRTTFFPTSAWPWNLEVVGEYVYLAEGSAGLEVIDVSDPANPVHAGGCDTDGEATDLFVVGNVAYLADGPAGLQITDITNPTNPVRLGQCQVPGQTYGVYAKGDYAYVTAIIDPLETDNNGLWVIDVSDPSAPIGIGSFTTGGVLDERVIEPVGGYLYVQARFGYPNLQVIDIRDPTNPSLAGGLRTAYRVRAACLAGDYAYAALSFATDGSGKGPSVLQVVDIRDRAKPRTVGELPLTDLPEALEGCDIQVAGPMVYVAEGVINTSDRSFDARLAVVDVSTLSKPTTLTVYSFSDAPYASELHVAGNYAYVVVGSSSRPGNGLHVIDIREPANPVRVGLCPLPYPSATVGQLGHSCLVGRYVYLTDFQHGLHVIDVLDPRNPIRVSAFHSTDDFCDVSANAGYLYVASAADTERGGLHILNISNPTNPVVAGSVLRGQLTLAVRADGHYVYAYSWGDTHAMHVMDAIDPSQPTLLASQPLRADWGLGSRICSQGNLVVTAAEDGLAFLEISPVLRLNPPLLSGGSVSLSWPGGPGIRLQKTTNLAPTDWQDVAGSDGLSSTNLPVSGSSEFFRLVKP